MRRLRSGAGAAAVLAICCLWTAGLSAQLDPLLFLKRVPPNVIVVFDTSLRMLEDGSGNLYDPGFYLSSDANAVAAFPTINPATTPTYRRTYRNLGLEAAPGKYTADSMTATAAVWDPAVPLTSNSPADLAYLNPTRFMIAKQGLIRAVTLDTTTVRWGLVRMRQVSPQWRVSPNCDKPVGVLDAAQAAHQDVNPCSTGAVGKFGIYVPSITASTYAQASAPAGTVMVTPSATSGATLNTLLQRGVGDNAGLIPTSIGGVGFDDRPLTYGLVDAKAAITATMAADTAASRSCRNTVVILLTSGADAGDAAYVASHNPATTALDFQAIAGGGVTKRAPVFVISVKAPATAEAQLRAIATNSGGTYAAASTMREVANAISTAIQTAYTRSADFEANRASEFLPTSPIVGTVNLKNAASSTGVVLPNTDITSNPGGQSLPQRSNVMISSGFALPGFTGQMRAFRVFKPTADATKAVGWKFVADGTPLWPDLDGRPSLAGLARIPADPNTRNIYTYAPDGSGGGTVVAFTAANAATLAAAMGTGANTASTITWIRSQPLGAIVGSTPALMDPPSLDPPPDDDYGHTDADASFAGMHKDRRSIIFFGANDGMIHAVDARTGFEVWAFIPYNLLPKLQQLPAGQPVEQFNYFVDSSPKIAEVKLGGHWRTLLIIGQGQGGTFYQTFDVTEAGMGVDPASGDIGAVNSLLSRFDAANESIEFKWSFPNYSSFDPTVNSTLTVSDGLPGGKVRVIGDLKATASYAEKTVGFTWSDPAVGALNADRSVTAVIVGSGYFPDIESLLPGRGAAAPRAGNALYLIDAATGQLIGDAAGNTCPTISSGMGTGSGCVNIGDVAANGRKNAIQADPTAAGVTGSAVVSKAYVGDTDGRYWRFTFNAAGTIFVDLMNDTGAPIYSSSALLYVGSSDIYMFVQTGSDLLPATAPGGTGTFRLYGFKDNAPGAGATTRFATDLATVSVSGGITNGERPSTSPSVAGDIVFFTTTAEASGTPCSDYTSHLYSLTYAGGAADDSNGNGKIDQNESPIASTQAGRATAPFIVDQHLYFATSASTGASVKIFGDPEDFNNGIGQVAVRILSWREIR